MESTRQEIHHILRFYYLRGKNATKAAKKICEVYGLDTVMIRTAQRWLDRFHSGVVDVEDTPRTGRPIVVATDKIIEIIQVDRHVSIRSIGQEEEDWIPKNLDISVPHELTQENLLDRINACDALLKRNEFNAVLQRMVTGDEKWIT